MEADFGATVVDATEANRAFEIKLIPGAGRVGGAEDCRGEGKHAGRRSESAKRVPIVVPRVHLRQVRHRYVWTLPRIRVRQRVPADLPDPVLDHRGSGAQRAGLRLVMLIDGAMDEDMGKHKATWRVPVKEGATLVTELAQIDSYFLRFVPEGARRDQQPKALRLSGAPKMSTFSTDWWR
jgi:hypothetical protein